MAKQLPNQAMKRMSSISQLAKKSQEFKKEIAETESNTGLPEDVLKNIVMLEDDMLLDDPFNVELYGINDTNAMAETMRKYGFRGIILAYPYEDKYMIESGHRRREAARKAGLSKYPVFITEPPKSEWERRLNLIMGNLHGRKNHPMIMARVAQGLYDVERDRIKEAKAEGTMAPDERVDINAAVGELLEYDSTTVELYRRLNHLIPELQEIVTDTRYSWSAIAYASNMSESYQKKLYHKIIDITDKMGIEAVTKKWIKTSIQRLKAEEKGEEIDKIVKIAEGRSTRVRRKNGTKIIMNSTKNLKEVLEGDAIIRDSEVDAVVDTLKELKKSIEKKLAELTK